jgi:hypothetical protein
LIHFRNFGAGILLARDGIEGDMNETAKFDQHYRVVAVDGQNLIVRGIQTGDVITITNAVPDVPLSSKEYPVGKLISLSISVPATGLAN